MFGQKGGGNGNRQVHWRIRLWQQRLHRIRISLTHRGWRATLVRIGQVLRPPTRHDPGLDLGPREDVPSHFVLPVSDTPEVSVIIPAYGQRARTLACLHAIARHGAHTAFEVIVVDDASTDDTDQALHRVEGLRVLTHADNRGFIASCNDGAAMARGRWLHFLNNDTLVQPGWLDALLACAREEPACGIAGSRLVYPDGRLQEAGGLLYRDGSAANIGRFEGRDALPFRFRREVDYVSGASLLIERSLFERLGGFDAHYAPAYYEDSDLAMRVRALGLRVLYAPDSLVVHDEGGTAGTDTTHGVKRHQAINRDRFVARHRDVLASHAAPGSPIETALRRYARGRMLVVDSTMPEPSRDSGSLRLCELFALLHGMGWQVIFMPEDGRVPSPAVDRLGALGVQVLPDGLARWLRRHGASIDAVMLCRAASAATWLDLVRQHAPRARVLFDTVDLHFLREARAAEAASDTRLARRAAITRRRELALVAACDVTFVVSPVERDLLARAMPAAHIEIVSNIHRVHGRHAGFEERRDLLFLGGHGHPPNADAMDWLSRDILPRIRQQVPDIVLHVLGDVPDTARRALAGTGLVFHGRVAELAPFMNACRVSVAPLRFGAGVKGKVNMAMSYGVPVVATPVAAEGMHLRDGDDVRLAADADAFASAVLEVYRDPALWWRLSDGGMENVRRHFSPEAAATTLQRVLQGAGHTATTSFRAD